VFTGAVPKPVVEQALRIAQCPNDGDIFICCSGSFRIEQALTAMVPKARLHSNDVSLLSVAIGQLLTHGPMGFKFTNRLEFLEELCGKEPIRRLSGIGLALTMSKYAGKNAHALAHFAHYQNRAVTYLDSIKQRFEKYFQRVAISSFFAGDFLEHANHAIERGAMVFAWPPTYKGGYENLYKFVNANVEWTAPEYGLWNPAKLPEWLDELDAKGANYCVFSDCDIPGRTPSAVYAQGRMNTVHVHASHPHGSSVRRDSPRVDPFRYKPIDPWALTAETEVKVISVDSARMNFVKDKYLMPGLAHSDGSPRYLVFLDGMLAGGFIHTRSQMCRDEIYLLSDFSASRERKLSKLIALLATGQEAVSAFEKKAMVRVKLISTTVFTDKPVSMKYRGIFDLQSRKPTHLQYGSPPRRLTNRQIYEHWWDRFARNESRPKKAT
jgi:hypothetical protein